MNIKPLSNQVVILPLDDLFETEKRPDFASRGVVITVGIGKHTDKGKIIKMEINVGDKVLYGKYCGINTLINGERHLIVSEDDILARIDKNN